MSDNLRKDSATPGVELQSTSHSFEAGLLDTSVMLVLCEGHPSSQSSLDHPILEERPCLAI